MVSDPPIPPSSSSLLPLLPSVQIPRWQLEDGKKGILIGNRDVANRDMFMIQWGTVSDLVVAAGTVILAVVAVFQETIRGWVYRPKFRVSAKTEPPDCVAVPFTLADGTTVANTIHFRLWIENVGNATAKNAEVYAKELRRQRADGSWERVGTFPPMNLSWANVGGIYFPRIAPEMGKHCDIA